MNMKSMMIAGILVLTPMAGFAMGCSGGHGKQAMSCAEGTIYDADKGACVPLISS